jgi:RNA polymerase sigma-70 factor (ECF subfamily)
MAEDDDFEVMIRRVRQGDAEAAEELVRRFAPQVRRVARFRLTDPRLVRQLDSMDVCQSVLGSFFTRAALGQFDLETPQQLLALLGTMARNKVAAQARRPDVRRRDPRPFEPGADARDEPVCPAGSPSERLVSRDLLDAFRARLSPDERRLADLRSQGRVWAEVAGELGESPEALRKQLARAFDRVARELGLED